MIEILGIAGTIFLAVAGIPQLIKVLREGHADGLSGAMLWCWLFGLLTFLVYVIYSHPADYVLLANYSSNIVIVGLLIKYKHYPRNN